MLSHRHTSHVCREPLHGDALPVRFKNKLTHSSTRFFFFFFEYMLVILSSAFERFWLMSCLHSSKHDRVLNIFAAKSSSLHTWSATLFLRPTVDTHCIYSTLLLFWSLTPAPLICLNEFIAIQSSRFLRYGMKYRGLVPSVFMIHGYLILWNRFLCGASHQ